jgi:hypothetical protein
MYAGPLGLGAHRIVSETVSFVSPVGEIEPEHVRSGGDKRSHGFQGAAGRPECGDDLDLLAHENLRHMWIKDNPRPQTSRRFAVEYTKKWQVMIGIQQAAKT